MVRSGSSWSAAGSSRSASGLPSARRRIQSRLVYGTASERVSRIAWEASMSSGPSVSSGMPGAGNSGAKPSRTTRTIPIDSVVRRLAANSSASVESRSSQWASSITTYTGRCAEASTSRFSTARPTWRRWGRPVPSPMPSAVRSASACAAGRFPIRSRSGCSSIWRPAYDQVCSASTPRVRRTVKPSARGITASTTADLPMPGSPRTTQAPPCPRRAPSRRAWMVSSSTSLP